MDEAAEDIEWPIGMAVMLLILLITGTVYKSHDTYRDKFRFVSPLLYPKL